MRVVHALSAVLHSTKRCVRAQAQHRSKIPLHNVLYEHIAERWHGNDGAAAVVDNDGGGGGKA
jgi:hypothetical protein